MYKIIGTDGREYGPISGVQLRQWIAEGRVESRTPVFVDGAREWNFVGLLPEFATCFATPPVALARGPLRRNNSSATTGLTFGVLSWLSFCCCCGCFGFPFNLLGLVFSLIALAQINRHPELYEGRGQAIAGLVLSLTNLLLILLGLMWSVATGHFEVNGMKF